MKRSLKQLRPCPKVIGIGRIGAAAGTRSAPRAAMRERLVVAEDDDDVRALVATTLRLEGYEVDEARDGDQLAVALERPAAAVVSDLRMPGHNPLATLARLRRDGIILPFIVITALDDDYTHAQAARLGVAAVFHKPIDPGVLRGAVRRLIAEELAAMVMVVRRV